MAPAPSLTPFFPSHSLLPSLSSFTSSLPAFNDPTAFKLWWLNHTTDPLHPALVACAVLSALVWVVGEVTGNVSQVDRLWAILPLLYSAHFTFWPSLTGAASGIIDKRMLLIFGLQILWSLRLNTNTYRRGFFNPKSEDYRWLIVRDLIPTWAFKILNLTFIAIIQNLLLLAVELPQYLLLTLHLSTSPASPTSTASKIASALGAHPTPSPSFSNPPLNAADWALAAVFVAILAIEMQSDNEQQRYQALKARAVEKGVKGEKLSEKEMAAVGRGFVTGGLWSYSRHPNFACEQSTWYILYLFTLLPFAYASYSSHSGSPSPFFGTSSSTLSQHLPSLKALTLHLTTLPQHALPTRSTMTLAAQEAYAVLREDEGVYWNYSLWGAIAMSLLFYSSTMLTEWISGRKYPMYAQYQSRVSMFWPPLTTVKGLWLAVNPFANKARVERAVWGVGGKKGGKKVKKL